MRDRLIRALRFAVDVSLLAIFAGYLVALSVRAAIWGGEGASDWDGWAGSYMFYGAILPFFLVNAAYLVACLAAGAGLDRMILFWASLAPFAGMLAAWLLRATTIAEAAHVGLLMVLVLTSLLSAGAALWWLGRRGWAWLIARRGGSGLR
jgi:hypothetical protein